MADTTYYVTGPGINVTNDEGGKTLLYQGAVVPEGQDPEWLEQMVKEGLISEDPGDALNPARGAVADVPDNSDEETTPRRARSARK